MKIDDLRTIRLTLRIFRQDDLTFLLDHFSNPLVSKYLYDHEPPASIEDARKILEWCMDFTSEDHCRWCIELSDGKKRIGTCGFHYADKGNHSAEIGYDLSHEYRGRGFMAEALKRMLTFGFDDLHLNRVYAYVFPMNLTSIHLLGRLGFTREGVIREKHLFRGKYYDHDLYSLLSREWVN